MNNALSANAPDPQKIRAFFQRTDVLLFLATLLLRLLALPFAQGLDSDDVTRVLYSYEWLEHPGFIQCDVWPSLHYYLIAFFIFLFNDHIFAPLLINVLLFALTVPVLYHFTKRLYDHEGAIFASIIFMFVTVFFRLSLEVMAEIPFFLLFMLCLLYLLKGLQGEMVDWKAGIIAGLLIAISSGFRLEGWIVTPLLAFIIILHRKYKLAGIFIIASLTYPLFWMLTCYLATGDPLYSLHQSAEWNHTASKINNSVDNIVLQLRTYIQPISIMLMLSPWLLVVLIAGMFRKMMNKSWKFEQWIWLVPFLLIFGLYQYKTYVGDMNVHPRYSSTLILLLIPHFGLLSSAFRGKWLTIFVLASALLNPVLSFYFDEFSLENLFKKDSDGHYAMLMMKTYQLQKEQAIPILRDRKILEYEEVLFPSLGEKAGLILDFLDWESTYHMMLHSGIQRYRMLILIGDVLDNTYKNTQVPPFMLQYPEGMLLLKKGSGVFQRSSNLNEAGEMLLDNSSWLKVNLIFEDERVQIFSYRWLRDSETIRNQ